MIELSKVGPQKPLFKSKTSSHAVFVDEHARLQVLVERADVAGRMFWDTEYDQGVVASVLGEVAITLLSSTTAGK